MVDVFPEAKSDWIKFLLTFPVGMLEWIVKVPRVIIINFKHVKHENGKKTPWDFKGNHFTIML